MPTSSSADSFEYDETVGDGMVLNAITIRFCILMLVGVLTGTLPPPNEFRLTKDGVGPLVLVTEVVVNGRDAQLKASARNDSGQPIRYAKFCVVAEGRTKGCDFEIWTTAIWKPGEELTWSPLKAAARPGIQNLSVTITNLDTAVALPAPVTSKPVASPQPSPVTSAQPVATQNVSPKPQKDQKDSSAPFSAQLQRLPPGTKIFITPMDKNLDGFITAEIQKQKVPIVVVLKQEEAQYVLTGFSQITGTHWAEQVAASVFGGKDKYEAECKLVTADGSKLMWSGEAGDRSILFGALRVGGQRKVAERLVDQMKHDLFGK
jgi:hypothetical protein